MKEQKDFPTTGHKEYTALQVSVWHGSKAVTLSIYPAILQTTGFTQVMLNGENLQLDVMPRLNRKKLEQLREEAFKQIEAKEGVAYDFFKKSLAKWGMTY